MRRIEHLDMIDWFLASPLNAACIVLGFSFFPAGSRASGEQRMSVQVPDYILGFEQVSSSFVPLSFVWTLSVRRVWR
jgi:hypothetical protein